MSVNAAHNMMYLPRSTDGSGKAVHAYFKLGGCAHNDYNDRITNKLDKLEALAEKEKWSKDKIQRALLDLQNDMRASLNKGVVP
jgi:hypothetical protein